MVQAGAAYDYDDRVGESTEPSWTNTISDAVKEFISAVAESSNQLASAAEVFAAESMQSIDAAASRAERSASTSSEMAEVAQQAAAAARAAVDGFQSVVTEAGERIRNEAGQGAELHVSQVQAAGERLRTDLQGHVDDMIFRIENAAGSNQDAIAAAELATNAAREAADRVQQSVAAVEAAVASAQRSAEQAQAAAEQAGSRIGAIDEAVRTAREAAEAARQSADQAGAQSTSLGNDAALLLERLETDYDLLTRLVRELHGRIASLSLPAVPSAPSVDAEEAAPEPVGLVDTPAADAETPEVEATDLETSYTPYVSDEPVWEIAPGVSQTSPEAVDEVSEPPAGYTPYVTDENPASEMPAHVSEVSSEVVVEPTDPEAAYTPYVSDESAAWEMPAHVSEVSSEAMVEASEPEAAYTPYVSDESPAWEMPAPVSEVSSDAAAEASEPEAEASEPEANWAQGNDETVWESTASESAEEPEELAGDGWAPAAPVEAEAEAEEVAGEAWVAEAAVESEPELEPISVMIKGYVQVRIAPVPDFDRLLNLDGALSRVNDVESVTLADYAQEEVTFRVEVLNEKDAGLFAREIGQAAGFETRLIDAADNSVIVRIK